MGGTVLGARLAEADVEEEVAAWLDGTGLWRVFRQVMGRPLLAPQAATSPRVRCDVLVLASRRGLAAGWRHGPIVLEVKRPGEPLGPAFSQLLNYLRCSWTLPNGVPVLAEWGFVYPAEPVHGPLASVLAQNRVGTAALEAGELHLACGEQRVLTIGQGGALRIGETRIGRRFGSRG